jgi:hypothetical protein
MFTKPILFLIFNRIEHSSKVFESIKDIKPSQLFIAADGPRLSIIGEKEKCDHLRDLVLDKIDWECKVYTLFRETNLGCGLAVSSAISWFFEHVEEGIILEDDCLPNKSFFLFCEENLNRYRSETRVGIISGTNFGIVKTNIDEADYFFSSFSGIWGWATWKRFWVCYDFDMKSYSEKKFKTLSKKLFQIDAHRGYWIDIFNKVKGKYIDTWDYQLVYCLFLNELLCIIPKKNLVLNIGFSDSATHTKADEGNFSKENYDQLNFPFIHPQKVEKSKDVEFFIQETIYGSFIKPKLLSQLKTFIKYLIK